MAGHAARIVFVIVFLPLKPVALKIWWVISVGGRLGSFPKQPAHRPQADDSHSSKQHNS